MQLIKIFKFIEQFFGNLKFAVFIILLFCLALAWGTYYESAHGMEYANRLIYKSPWFIAIQVGMFLSILFATTLRLPPKKYLYGFYTLHLGLLILFMGSFITFIGGIEGAISLRPNQVERVFQTNRQELKITWQRPGEIARTLRTKLPYWGRAGDLNLDFLPQQNFPISLADYLPFAEYQVDWQQQENKTNSPSSVYRIRAYLQGRELQQDFTLSLHPSSNLPQNLMLGPLNVHYFPEALAQCFSGNFKYLIWERSTGKCMVLGATRSLASDLLRVDFFGKELLFRPDLSPFSLDQNLKVSSSAPYRLLEAGKFMESPHLFIMGEKITFFDQGSFHNKSLKQGAVKLPWMDFELELLRHEREKYPRLIPHPVRPIQYRGDLTRGDMQAILVLLGDQKIWVDSRRLAGTQLPDGTQVSLSLGPRLIELPFELTLERFVVEMDPMTENPASFESFVSLFTGEGPSTLHHIHMNAPLKVPPFTFYQASYFEIDESTYGSMLSVNYDPGRPYKYTGAFLLISGSLWHFLLRRRRRW